MGREVRNPGRKWGRRGLWVLLLAMASAGGIRASGLPPEQAEGIEAPLQEGPLPPLGPSPDEGGAEEPDALPGRENPEEFYKPPPRPQKRITKLPA